MALINPFVMSGLVSASRNRRQVQIQQADLSLRQAHQALQERELNEATKENEQARSDKLEAGVIAAIGAIGAGLNAGKDVTFLAEEANSYIAHIQKTDPVLAANLANRVTRALNTKPTVVQQGVLEGQASAALKLAERDALVAAGAPDPLAPEPQKPILASPGTVVLSPDGTTPLYKVPESPDKPVRVEPTNLAKLIAERDALAPGDPAMEHYNNAITAATTDAEGQASIANAVALPILQKVQAGQTLTPGELAAWDMYTRVGLVDQLLRAAMPGGMPLPSPAEAASVSAETAGPESSVVMPLTQVVPIPVGPDGQIDPANLVVGRKYTSPDGGVWQWDGKNFLPAGP